MTDHRELLEFAALAIGCERAMGVGCERGALRIRATLPAADRIGSRSRARGFRVRMGNVPRGRYR